jgi:hypothetical protein
MPTLTDIVFVETLLKTGSPNAMTASTKGKTMQDLESLNYEKMLAYKARAEKAEAITQPLEALLESRTHCVRITRTNDGHQYHVTTNDIGVAADTLIDSLADAMKAMERRESELLPEEF